MRYRKTMVCLVSTLVLILSSTILGRYFLSKLDEMIDRVNSKSLEYLDNTGSSSTGSTSSTSVNLVIAHPDDEIMFFSPLLNVLASSSGSSGRVRVLCLSTGDNDGLGHVRVGELEESVLSIFGDKRLGLQVEEKEKVEVVVGDFEDGMGVVWDSYEIGERYLDKYVTDARPLFVTFDQGGVSGHANHVSCYTAVMEYYRDQSVRKSERTRDVRVLSLKTPSFVKKYSSVLLLPYYMFSTEYTYDNNNNNNNKTLFFANTWQSYLDSLHSMKSNHKSQMVWFRYFWWVLSSPVFYNIYEYFT